MVDWMKDVRKKWRSRMVPRILAGKTGRTEFYQLRWDKAVGGESLGKKNMIARS